jgi:hypothetical protein
MPDFAYTTVPGKVPTLLAKIRQVGVPPKVTLQWLKPIGLTSSNDTSLIPVLKAIGFVDGSGAPTSKWAQYRGSDYKRVLGDALREGYADLFAVYADANTRSHSDLDHVFRTSTSAGEQVVSKTVGTFKALAAEAVFPALGENSELHSDTPLHVPAGQPPQATSRGPRQPSVHIDVQVHISPEASAEQIDQVFASMAKHLYGAARHEA